MREAVYAVIFPKVASTSEKENRAGIASNVVPANAEVVASAEGSTFREAFDQVLLLLRAPEYSAFVDGLPPYVRCQVRRQG